MRRGRSLTTKALALALVAVMLLAAMPALAADPIANPATQLDTSRRLLRVTHGLLVAANNMRLLADYEGDDAIAFYYTTDGTAPSKTNGERIKVYPSTGAPRAYIDSLVGGTLYRIIAYEGEATSGIVDYQFALDAPTWTQLDGTPLGTSGLHAAAEVAGGIKLAVPEGQEIYFRTATVAYDVDTGLFSASEIDSVTAAQLRSDGALYSAPLQVPETVLADGGTALLIKATAVKGTLAPSAVSTFYCRVGDLVRLQADADGNLLTYLDAFIAQLTLDERISLTGGVGGDPTTLLNGLNYPLESNNDGIPMRGGPAGGTPALPRFNVPSLVLADGPAGVRMWKNATVWMAPAGLGSTWNPEIPKKIGEVTADEARHYAVDIVLGPGLNMQRNPLAGRNFEYYSEDPYISGIATRAYVGGIQSGGVGTSLKHYVANDAESNRSRGSSNVSERALREVYLRGFEMAAEVQPWTYMAGYNAVNGINVSANKFLLTDVLRGDWGFKGFVMSDWGADYSATESLEAQMDMGQSSRSAATVRTWITATNITEEERARRVDLLNRSVKNILGVMVKTSAFQGDYGVLQPDGSYADGVKIDGTPVEGLTQADIGYRSGAFGGSDVQKASAVVNKQAADEAIVMLKNADNLLPLAEGTKLALVTNRLAWSEFFNPRWYGDSASVGDVVIQGTGSAQVRFNNNTTPYTLSLRDALADRGFDVVDWKIDNGAYGGNDAAFKAAFTDNPPANGNAKYVYSDVLVKATAAETAANTAATRVSAEEGAANAKAAAEAAAAAADVGIFVLTRVSGEGSDLAVTAFNLTALERTVFDAYADAFHAAGKKLVVLINVGGTVNTTEFRAKADAILDIWNPGTEGTRAIADILKGAVNPSGKLAQTFPQTYSDSPSIAMNKHPGTTFNSRPAYYDEGVYIGYRYYETFPEKYDTMVAYPFGYGLSYTKFAFSDLTLDKFIFDKDDPDEKVTATVKVTNTGSVAGKEVVQLYLSANTWQEEGRPKNELRAYGKTKLLAPGESETVSLSLTLRDLQYYDDANPDNITDNVQYGNGTGWTVADGTVFTVTIRDNAENAEKPNSPVAGLTEQFVYEKIVPKFDIGVDVLEWGSAVTHLIVDAGFPVDASAVRADLFNVTALTKNPVNGNVVYDGARTVTKAYVSATKEKGKPADSGQYIVLELKYGYNATNAEINGSAAIIYQSRNYWLDLDYAVTITDAIAEIPADAAFAYRTTFRPIYDDFELVDNPVEGYTAQRYRMYTPEEAQDGKPLPLVVFNHGAGETYGTAASGTVNNEGAQLFANMGGVGWVKNAPASYVLVPQRSFSSYSRDGVVAFIKDLIARGLVDGNRVYVSGASAGGQETHNYLLEYPDLWAGAIPICPASGSSITAARLATITHIPIWYIHADDDRTVAQPNSLTPYERLLSLNAKDARRTSFPGVFGTEVPNDDYPGAAGKPGEGYYPDGHWSWVMVLNNEFVENGGIPGSTQGVAIMDWLFAQRKTPLNNTSTAEQYSVTYDDRVSEIDLDAQLLIVQYDEIGRLVTVAQKAVVLTMPQTFAVDREAAAAKAFLWSAERTPIEDAATLK
ncbi:MAG: glycoside hydrolase family 3 C-terminal domain-containing protein [Oscillospiraceae bacterium]|nr:glycoside hydrolase family 3 C-terminal domain-containing protein [Oscillospiraceae bacterium]